MRTGWYRACVLGLAATACAGGEQVRGSASPSAEQAPRRSAEAVVAERRAPVPEPSAGELVAFSRGGSIALLDPATGAIEPVTVRADDAADTDPALSPRGDTVAYASARDGRGALYLVSLDDLIPEPLTDGGDGGDRQPAWAPGGDQLAFVRTDAAGRSNLFVVDAAGGAPRLVLEGDDAHPELVGAPAFSPDGTRIAFAADRRRGEGVAIWEVGVDGTGLRRVTPARAGAPWTRDLEPSYAPGGGRIVFASNRHVASADDADDTDLYAVAPDGSGLTRLTEDRGAARHPSHSADGARLYFASTRIRTLGFEWELYVMAAGGGEQRRVTRDAQPQNTAPSASSRR